VRVIIFKKLGIIKGNCGKVREKVEKSTIEMD